MVIRDECAAAAAAAAAAATAAAAAATTQGESRAITWQRITIGVGFGFSIRGGQPRRLVQ
jgi:hypothetical protein